MTSLVAFLVRALSGVRVRWLGADPLDCQRVYFANHTSNLDAAVLWAALPPLLRKTTRPVAARDYWTLSAARRWLASEIFRAVLIERRKVTNENNPLRQMIAVRGRRIADHFSGGWANAGAGTAKFQGRPFPSRQGPAAGTVCSRLSRKSQPDSSQGRNLARPALGQYHGREPDSLGARRNQG
jgi:hypothetical protein